MVNKRKGAQEVSYNPLTRSSSVFKDDFYWQTDIEKVDPDKLQKNKKKISLLATSNHADNCGPVVEFAEMYMK